MGSDLFLLLNLCSTWFLIGLIWLVQVVVYPQFLRVSPDCFTAYHAAHLRAVTHVVAPAMLIELISSVALIVHTPAGVPKIIPWIGIACVAICWISTAAVQVPLHNLLATGFNAGSARKLVFTNWLRTISWSIHGIVLMYSFLIIRSAVPA